MKNLIFHIGLFTLLFLGNSLLAQEKIQLVTKQIEKRFTYKEGNELNVEGEKADVNVKTWKKSEILVELELSAEHASRATAEKDLERMQYQLKKVQGKVYLRNYIKTAESEEAPTSSLSAKYVITVPEDCPVYLKNYFGLITASDLMNRLKINSKFSKIGLANLQGNVDVRTAFGDLEGQQLDGEVQIASRRSNITLREIKGKYDITVQYGIATIFADQNLLDLNIKAEQSDVFLYNPDPQTFAYDIDAQNANLSLPNELKFKYLQNSNNLKKANFKPQQEFFANISITISFGDLFIGNKSK